MRRTHQALVVLLAPFFVTTMARAGEPPLAAITKPAETKPEPKPVVEPKAVTTSKPAAGTIEIRLMPPAMILSGVEPGPGIGVLAGDPPTTLVLNLGGGAGYFIDEHIEAGGELGITDWDVHGGGNLFNFYVGPFGRYLMPLEDAFSAWGEARLGILYSHGGAGSLFGNGNSTEFRIGAGAGIDYNLNPNLAVFAGAGIDLYMGDIFVVPILITYGLRGYL